MHQFLFPVLAHLMIAITVVQVVVMVIVQGHAKVIAQVDVGMTVQAVAVLIVSQIAEVLAKVPV